jgi:hypothetical protein
MDEFWWVKFSTKKLIGLIDMPLGARTQYFPEYLNSNCFSVLPGLDLKASMARSQGKISNHRTGYLMKGWPSGKKEGH